MTIKGITKINAAPITIFSRNGILDEIKALNDPKTNEVNHKH
jgi:hypothetical protein